MKKLEVACFSLQSAYTAMAAGAHRIEFCFDYKSGGITPALIDFKLLKARENTPIYVMIRPRGGDFVYSHNETEEMRASIEVFASAGADGFVFGALTENSRVDMKSCHDLLKSAAPLPVTFHRAFDRCPDPFEALNDIISLGFKNILSSGKQNTVLEGAPMLNELKMFANGKISFVAGGGVRSSNIKTLMQAFDTEFYHSSCIIGSETNANEDEIKKIINILKASIDHA